MGEENSTPFVSHCERQEVNVREGHGKQVDDFEFQKTLHGRPSHVQYPYVTTEMTT